MLLAESEGMLQRIVDEFNRLCKRRKLKVNAGKSKVMVFETAKEQIINFAKPYRVGLEAIQSDPAICGFTIRRFAYSQIFPRKTIM